MGPLLGSSMLPPDFAGDFDMEYFTSVSNFLDHEPDANYIEQSLVRRHNMMSPHYFGLHKNYFYRSVPVSLYGLVASACIVISFGAPFTISDNFQSISSLG